MNVVEATHKLLIEKDDVADILKQMANPAGSKGDSEGALKEWSARANVEVEDVPAFKKHPNRVWYSAVPPGVIEDYKEEFKRQLPKGVKADELILTMYESGDARSIFRESAAGILDRVVVSGVSFPCPFEYDLWNEREGDKPEPAPDLPKIKPV